MHTPRMPYLLGTYLPYLPSITVHFSVVVTGSGRKKAHWGEAGGEGEASGASEQPGCADGH